MVVFVKFMSKFGRQVALVAYAASFLFTGPSTTLHADLIDYGSYEYDTDSGILLIRNDVTFSDFTSKATTRDFDTKGYPQLSIGGTFITGTIDSLNVTLSPGSRLVQTGSGDPGIDMGIGLDADSAAIQAAGRVVFAGSQGMSLTSSSFAIGTEIFFLNTSGAMSQGSALTSAGQISLQYSSALSVQNSNIVAGGEFTVYDHSSMQAASSSITAAQLFAVLDAAHVNLSQGSSGVTPYTLVGMSEQAFFVATIPGASFDSTIAYFVDGSLNIDNSTWSTQTLGVGIDGTGSLNVLNGGTLFSSLTSGVGILPTSVGHMAFDGLETTWGHTGTFGLGVQGIGTLAMSNSAMATIAGNLIVGQTAGSQGTLTLNGSLSPHSPEFQTKLFAGPTTIGLGGAANVVIDQGAQWTTSGSGAAAVLSTSTAQLLVTGQTSSWKHTGDFTLASFGQATLAIQDTATATIQGNLTTAQFSGSNATFSVNTGATAMVSGTLTAAQSAGSQAALTVVGAGSQLTTGQVVIGSSGTASVLIENGGQWNTSGTSSVGLVSAGSGHVTVAGDDYNAYSLWTHTGALAFGLQGQASLTVANAGRVVITDSFTAAQQSTGSASINVDGGQLQANRVTIGGSGSANVLIQNAGHWITTGTSSAAAATTGLASLTIDGTGSFWSHTGQMILADQGQAQLTLSNTAVVTIAGQLIAASQANSQATIAINSVDVTHGSVLSADSLVLGDAGIASLTIDAGSQLRTLGAGGVDIGRGATGSGTATVTGGIEIGWQAGDMRIGGAGYGSVTVLDGASLSASSIVLGQSASGTGSLSIGQSSSDVGAVSVLSAGSLVVGSSGSGAMTVQNGAVATNAGAILGDNFDSHGAVTIDGAQLTSTAPLIVGHFGTGIVNVLDNGVMSTNETSVGSGVFSAGTVTVAGARWSNSGTMYVGYYGGGAVNALAGAIIEAGQIVVGSATSNATTISNEFFPVYDFSPIQGVGAITVSGSGSTLTLSQLSLGAGGGFGSLSVFDGTVTSTGAVFGSSTQVLAHFDTFDNSSRYATAVGGGSATISGAMGRWYNAGNLFLGGDGGSSGVGTLTIQNGAIADAKDTYLGYLPGATGGIVVTSTGILDVSALIVANQGSGELDVVNGGQVISRTGASIAAGAGASGIVNVTGTAGLDSFLRPINSIWSDTGDVYVGGSAAGPGGTGSLTIGAGGVVDILGNMKLWTDGALNLTGGTLNVRDLDVRLGHFNFTSGTLNVSESFTRADSLPVQVNQGQTLANNGYLAGTVVVNDHGIVKGNGTFDTLAVNFGGVVSPGNSPGTMTDSTTSWSMGGQYTWEINQLASNGGVPGGGAEHVGWDLWNTGILEIIPGFKIEIDSLQTDNTAGPLNGWDSSQSYQWLIASSSNDAFTASAVSGLTLDYLTQFAANNLLNGGTFYLEGSVDGSQLFLDFSPAAIPEPTAIALGATAISMLFWRLRRKPQPPDAGCSPADEMTCESRRL
ncbi:MAG TPA: hypothetical protein VG713_14130 [Pirellulales bacterium]|nr:hypothetical protein [Pirellulales bacterium]